MGTVKVTDETFVSEVLESRTPVLVDFWAEWCAPCRAVAPSLEELSDELEGSLKIAKVDVDACPQTAMTFRIRSIPTLMLFKDGQPIEAVQGALPKDQLKQALFDWLPELKGPLVSVDELAARLEAGHPTVVIDIRREQDFDRSHLRGALQCDPADLEAKSRELGPGKLLVLVDRTGVDATAEATKLKALGLTVVALEKGLLEWEGSGRPTYSTREEQALVVSA